MIYKLAVLSCMGLLSQTEALQLPAAGCVSRVSASRVLAPAVIGRAAVFLCDAEAAAEEPAAVAAAEPAPARKPKASKTPIEELEVGAEVEGKIRSVMAYGAFVDVGASTDGLLHVSEICNEFVKDATEKLTAGDTIKCRIKAVNLEKQQLALTAKDPSEARPQRKPRADLSEFEGADVKAFIAGTVSSITDCARRRRRRAPRAHAAPAHAAPAHAARAQSRLARSRLTAASCSRRAVGAFVTIKEGVDGLVHISQIQDGGVGKVSDVLTIGQEVQVRITQVDKSNRRIGLSMREWTEEEDKPRRGGGGGRGGDTGFGEADKEFHLTEEELTALEVGDEFDSPFVAAFERAAAVQKAKAEKKKYPAQVL
jgi:predicted RNA-binding protein with RPS1 domain